MPKYIYPPVEVVTPEEVEVRGFPYTRQELINLNYQRFCAEGKKRSTGEGACLYQKNGDCRCAIGWALTKVVLDAWAGHFLGGLAYLLMESDRQDELPKIVTLSEDKGDLTFVRALQGAHDADKNSEDLRRPWKDVYYDRLKSLCDLYRLTLPERRTA